VNRFLICIGMCLAIVAATTGQVPKYGATVTVDKNVDFGKFKTYSWTPGRPSAAKVIDARVIAAVDRELSALGMSKATAGSGDVLATYYSLSRTDVNLKAKPDATGTLPQYWVGTLVVALLDPADRHRLLRLRVDQPIEIEPAKLEVAIDSAVHAMFAKYPTRRR
jgi:Domain of unknown function (DUF4136)